MLNFLRNTLTVFFALQSLVSTASQNAYDIPADTSSITLQEVSITAAKQSPGNDAATATATLLQTTLERHNISAPKDVSLMVPNLHMPDYGSRITSSIYVRGIGARIDQPAVGMIIDNVPILNKDNYDFNILDIRKVEMMRGPQSTLFGRNTMAGVISITTISPLNFSGWRALAEYSSGNSWRAALSYYDMLSEKIGIGLAAEYYSSDGFFRNLYNGEKCDSERGWNARAKVHYTPGERWKIENVASLSITKQGGYPYAYISTGEINYNDTCFYRRTSVTDGLSVQCIGDFAKLSSVTSYQFIDDNMTLDQDFLPVSYFTLTQAKKEHAITQDIVLTSHANKKYRWLAGAFAFYKTTHMTAPVEFRDAGIKTLIEQHRNDANPFYPIRWDERTLPLLSDFDMHNFGLAAYHQSEYNAGNWKFTAAVRLDFEKSTLHYNSQCKSSFTTFDNTDGNEPYTKIFSHTDVNIDEHGSLSKSFLQLLPKISVVYSIPSLLGSSIYASFSKGYKAGGFNTQMFSDVLQQKVMNIMGVSAKYDVDDIVGYKPEFSWNYEIGSHISCLQNTLKADFALFFIDVKNQQLTVFPEGTTTGRIMTNAGKSRSFGCEIALNYTPDKKWRFDATYGYTNAKFVKYNDGINNFSGNFIPYAPQNTLYLGAAHDIAIKKNWLEKISVNINMRGVGRIYWNEQNSVSQPFYASVGASITFANINYSLQIWGDNITGTRYDTFYFVSMNNAFVQRGKKARFGATLRLNI